MPLLREVRGAVGVLTLSRPEARNAWGQDYNEGLQSAFAEWADDPQIRCVLVTGDPAGGAFSAGADMSDPKTHAERTPAEFVGMLRTPRSWITSLPEQFPKPVIAAVNGYAIGNSCIFSFSCDLIVASDRAEWRLPQVSLGIMPANGGSARLARHIGKGNAMRMILGFPLKAQEALQQGLAQWVVPHEEHSERALEIAERIAGLPPLAARLTKESLVRGLDTGAIAEAALADVYRVSVLERTLDAKEAHTAWREKRKPVFEGR